MSGLHPHEVEAEEGDGALDQIEDKYDGAKYASRDERAPTDTTFWQRDIDQLPVSKRRKRRLTRMLRRQEGENQNETYYEDRPDRKQQNTREWKRRLVHTYVAHLEMTDHQKERSKHIVNDVIDINRFGHFSTEEVILGVVNVVAREDGRWIEDEREFRNLAEDAELDLSDLKTLRGMVRDRLSSYE
jgi:hypothetical protein